MSSTSGPVLGYAAIVAKGFCMGAADVVPGVSGGTMAFILGIYERLLRAIRAFDLGLLRLLAQRQLRAATQHVDLWFLFALGAGIVLALAVFTRVIPLPSLIRTDPVPVYSFFFGLVAASIVVLLGQIDLRRGGAWLWAGLGIAGGLALANLVPSETPEGPLFLFASGAVAICAMILPGVSGSFILLVLKKYATVLDAVARFDLTVLIPFALGAACGLMLFSRFLTWLIGRFRAPTLATIIGILIGSLWMIWPFQERVFETVRGKERLIASTPVGPWQAGAPLGVAVAWMAGGLALVLLVSWLAAERAKAS